MPRPTSPALMAFFKYLNGDRHGSYRNSDLSPLHLSVLLQVRTVSWEHTSKTIAAALDLHKTRLSRAIQVLVEQDLLVRIYDHRDRRVHRLVLTRAGSDLIDQIHEKFQAAAHEFMTEAAAEKMQATTRATTRVYSR